MNRHLRRANASQKLTLQSINFEDSGFHSRIERTAPAAALPMSLGDGMGPESGWTSSIIEVGVVRQKFSPVFQFLVRMLLRPRLLVRIHQPETLWFLGVMAQRVGKEQLGKHLIERAIGLNPSLGRRKILVENPAGRTLAEWLAETQRSPDSAEAWLGLGKALLAKGDDEGAMSAFHLALEKGPDLEEGYANLGTILLRRAQYVEAEGLFRKQYKLAPRSSRSLNNLANAVMLQGRLPEAIGLFRKAVSLGPDNVEPLNNLGNALSRLGHVEQAVSYYAKARKLSPRTPEVLMNLGTALHARGDFKSAAECYLQALEIRPGLAEAYINLATLLQSKSKPVEAEAAYRVAIETLPHVPSLPAAMGNLLQNLGRIEEAQEAYEHSLSIKEDAGRRVELAILSPVVYDSMEQATAWRDIQRDAIAALEAKETRLQDPFSEVTLTNFYLAYPGLDDRPLQEQLAQFYLKACPNLAWTAPHLASGRGRMSRKRLRLGVVSAFLESTHTIGKLFTGLVAQIPRDRFEVVLFRFYAQSPGLCREADEKADKVVRLPLRPFDQLYAIANERLDILFYPDIGMSYHTYFMAFSRLAPVQVVAWGHPDTTGIPNLDYFVSTDYLDPPGNEAHYSEKLARLPLPPCYYTHPKLNAEELAGRQALKLPLKQRLYVCAQTLFKIHPEFRLALKKILERDREGVVVFIDATPSLTKRLSDSLSKELGADYKRVLFLAPLKHGEFLGLCVAADALLDTFHFSGGNSSLEAFAYGAPIITLPSAFMRGRVTAQFYKMMGIEDLIARDADHYVELALRLAQDKAWHGEMKQRILAAKDVLFENKDAVAHFADFLEKAALGQWQG